MNKGDEGEHTWHSSHKIREFGAMHGQVHYRHADTRNSLTRA